MSGEREPDVLEVIADLSNDEIFTPPAVANSVLDHLPASVWSDPTLRWLDPGSKTGVFLREATRRLMEGLTDVIPDDDERLEHILTEMMFGIAISDLTALMSRRSLYLSKDASGQKSAAQFADPQGHLWMGRVEHNYVNGRCSTCRAGEADFEGADRENHAYAFIHESGRKAIEKVFEMKFDVIVGNPPYQMTGGGGGTNDTPLYDQFVEQAKSLGPKYISMIIPSRWMAGGRGLDRFRKDMLADRRIRSLVDYPNSAELFPGVDLKSGVCYFFWDQAYDGDCDVTLVRGREVTGPYPRDLSEHDVFIRDNRAAEILKKVLAFTEPSFMGLLTGDTPFGLPTNYSGHHPGEPGPGEVKLYASTSSRRFEAAMERDLIGKNTQLIDEWKLLLPAAGPGNSGGHVLPDVVLGRTLIAGPNSVCTQTYLAAGPFADEDAAASAESYLRTRFLRFIVSLRKISQHAFRSTYEWVPQQEWDRTWTDEELYAKYGITEDEQAYIAQMVKVMST